MERKWKRWQILFSWAPKSLKMVTKVMKSKGTYSLKMLTPWKKSYDKPRKCIKKQKHYLAYKGLSSYSYGSFSSHVWMWELNHIGVWAPQNWCFWIVVLEKTLESPFHCKELKPVNPKGNQPWILIGRTDAEVEAPKLWPPMQRDYLLEKTLMLGTMEGRRRGWDGWMASPTQCTWVWTDSGR